MTFLYLMLSFISIAATFCQEAQSSPNLDQSSLSVQEKVSYSTSIYQSFFMIVINEIADKSFICVVLFSMKNSKLMTFLFAMIALTAMNLMAITIGFYIPFLVYRDWIDWIAIVAFTAFGLFNLYLGLSMESETLAHEIEEQEVNLEHMNELKEPFVINKVTDRIEYQEFATTREESKYVKVGYLAFLANMVLFECGDKTQIATIVIATVYNPIGVFIGTTCGFALCVLLAISCGKLLGQYITEKMTSIIAGIVFLLFAIQYFLIKIDVI
jgi:putative Ca2+/H+ antiporter (TMEM165/GDT1 family)